MNRYALTAVVLALFGSSASAQVPIAGAFPPWSPPSPPVGAPPFPPAPPILQPPPPYFVRVPTGDPLVGYFKMDVYYVGGRNWYPYDSGEFNLAGFAGNARYFGVFHVTIPPPADLDPINATVPYKVCRGKCK